jgi:hypothetical protein
MNKQCGIYIMGANTSSSLCGESIRRMYNDMTEINRGDLVKYGDHIFLVIESKEYRELSLYRVPTNMDGSLYFYDIPNWVELNKKISESYWRVLNMYEMNIVPILRCEDMIEWNYYVHSVLESRWKEINIEEPLDDYLKKEAIKRIANNAIKDCLV